MAGRNFTPEQERHVESHAPYMTVFWSLLVLTVLEYGYAKMLEGKIAFAYLVAGLMTMALIKASLVGWYFMHLKFEGRWIYLLLAPVGFLALVVVLGLTPDIASHFGGFYESPVVLDR